MLLVASHYLCFFAYPMPPLKAYATRQAHGIRHPHRAAVRSEYLSFFDPCHVSWWIVDIAFFAPKIEVNELDLTTMLRARECHHEQNQRHAVPYVPL